MATIVINNKIFTGSNILIKNNKIFVDGEQITPDSLNINIIVNGDIEHLNVDFCDSLGVKGNVNYIQTVSGDANIEGNVKGEIKTISGNVDCYNVGANITTTSGDVNCSTVYNSVKTVYGDIKYNKL